MIRCSYFRRVTVFLLVLSFLLCGFPTHTRCAEQKTAEPSTPPIVISKDVRKVIRGEAAEVKKHFEEQARSLFKRKPLGFDFKTLDRLRQWIFKLPIMLPDLIRHVLEQSRLLGFVGSLIMVAFLGVLFYSFIGSRKVLVYLEDTVKPMKKHISETRYPYFLSALKIIAASLIPLLIFGLFSFVQALITYDAPWFLLTGNFLKLWAAGALVISILRESLLPGYLPIPAHHAMAIYRVSRMVILYILFSIAIFWGAKVFNTPEDFLSLIRFIISLSIVFVSLFLLLKKQAIIGILPELPYKSYRIFYKSLERLYYPAIFVTFLTGLLWCFGYRTFTKFLWTRTWAVAGTFLAVMIVYHNLRGLLRGWIRKKDPADEIARALYKSLRTLLLFTTITTTLILTLRLLGFFYPLQKIISFPLLVIGNTPISLWTLVKAAIILTGFVFVSKLLRAYLDYKIYPALKIDEGLAYSLNTFLSYLFIAVGILFSLRAVGLDLRLLMVFTGAIGIGIGLGLQNMSANLISGFSLIFGQKIRKGDWIQIGDTRGRVKEVSLRVTSVGTRDNIEYLIPNSELTAGTIVNYTLSDPEIRIHVPVGVSYNSKPQEIVKILQTVADGNENLSKVRKRQVWFSEYGDNSLNFELLVWIDVRRVSEREVRSQLYFEIFNALEEAGIEIPFPQRDIHIRSGFTWPDFKDKK